MKGRVFKIALPIKMKMMTTMRLFERGREKEKDRERKGREEENEEERERERGREKVRVREGGVSEAGGGGVNRGQTIRCLFCIYFVCISKERVRKA